MYNNVLQDKELHYRLCDISLQYICKHHAEINSGNGDFG